MTLKLQNKPNMRWTSTKRTKMVHSIDKLNNNNSLLSNRHTTNHQANMQDRLLLAIRNINNKRISIMCRIRGVYNNLAIDKLSNNNSNSRRINQTTNTSKKVHSSNVKCVISTQCMSAMIVYV